MPIRRRMKYGREEWYAECPERTCSDQFSDTSKSDLQRALNQHARDHRDRRKAEVREAERVKAREQLDEAKAEKEQARKDKKDREAKARKLKSQMSAAAAKLNRRASGWCPHCNSNPCKGKKPGCARLKATRMESAMDQLDPSDPARFDEQLRWYNENM